MTKREAQKHIDWAIKYLKDDIGAGIDRNNKYSKGLAHEGYKGGYLHALYDVSLLLNGVIPNGRIWTGKR